MDEMACKVATILKQYHADDTRIVKYKEHLSEGGIHYLRCLCDAVKTMWTDEARMTLVNMWFAQRPTQTPFPDWRAVDALIKAFNSSEGRYTIVARLYKHIQGVTMERDISLLMGYMYNDINKRRVRNLFTTVPILPGELASQPVSSSSDRAAGNTIPILPSAPGPPGADRSAVVSALMAGNVTQAQELVSATGITAPWPAAVPTVGTSRLIIGNSVTATAPTMLVLPPPLPILVSGRLSDLCLTSINSVTATAPTMLVVPPPLPILASGRLSDL